MKNKNWTVMMTYDEFLDIFGPIDLEDIPEDAKENRDGVWYIIPELV